MDVLALMYHNKLKVLSTQALQTIAVALCLRRVKQSLINVCIKIGHHLQLNAGQNCVFLNTEASKLHAYL